MSETHRAVSTAQQGLRHTITIGEHTVAADEPRELGGSDSAPSPLDLLAASLASCTAITMQLYAARKEWDLSGVEVAVEFKQAERGAPTTFDCELVLPAHLSDEQADRLRAIAAKCPVHRALEGEAMFTETVSRRTAA